MCVIITAPKGALVEMPIIDKALERNGDGVGIVQIKYDAKGAPVYQVDHCLQPHEARKLWKKADTDTVRVFHARISTAGKKDLENTHPFLATGPDGIERYIAHNGTFRSMPRVWENYSDTWHFAKYLTLFEDTDDVRGWVNMFAKAQDSRICYISKGQAHMLGAGWIVREGVYYSNGSALGAEQVVNPAWRQGVRQYQGGKLNEIGVYSDVYFEDGAWNAGKKLFVVDAIKPPKPAVTVLPAAKDHYTTADYQMWNRGRYQKFDFQDDVEGDTIMDGGFGLDKPLIVLHNGISMDLHARGIRFDRARGMTKEAARELPSCDDRGSWWLMEPGTLKISKIDTLPDGVHFLQLKQGIRGCKVFFDAYSGDFLGCIYNTDWIHWGSKAATHVGKMNNFEVVTVDFIKKLRNEFDESSANFLDVWAKQGVQGTEAELKIKADRCARRMAQWMDISADTLTDQSDEELIKIMEGRE